MANDDGLVREQFAYWKAKMDQLQSQPHATGTFHYICYVFFSKWYISLLFLVSGAVKNELSNDYDVKVQAELDGAATQKEGKLFFWLSHDIF